MSTSDWKKGNNDTFRKAPNPPPDPISASSAESASSIPGMVEQTEEANEHSAKRVIISVCAGIVAMALAIWLLPLGWLSALAAFVAVGMITFVAQLPRSHRSTQRLMAARIQCEIDYQWVNDHIRDRLLWQLVPKSRRRASDSGHVLHIRFMTREPLVFLVFRLISVWILVGLTATITMWLPWLIREVLNLLQRVLSGFHDATGSSTKPITIESPFSGPDISLPLLLLAVAAVPALVLSLIWWLRWSSLYIIATEHQVKLKRMYPAWMFFMPTDTSGLDTGNAMVRDTVRSTWARIFGYCRLLLDTPAQHDKKFHGIYLPRGPIVEREMVGLA